MAETGDQRCQLCLQRKTPTYCSYQTEFYFRWANQRSGRQISIEEILARFTEMAQGKLKSVTFQTESKAPSAWVLVKWVSAKQLKGLISKISINVKWIEKTYTLLLKYTIIFPWRINIYLLQTYIYFKYYGTEKATLSTHLPSEVASHCWQWDACAGHAKGSRYSKPHLISQTAESEHDSSK